MDYFKDVEKLIEYIEKNLNEKMNIDDLASKIYFSKFHFQRIFKAVVGETAMNYIRKRKLTESLKMLKNSSKNILEIALDYDFNSQEAYTRAFKSMFGINPGKYKKGSFNLSGYEKINLLKRKMKVLNPGYLIDYEIVELDEINLFGVKMESNTESDNFEIMKGLWIRFLKEIEKNRDKILEMDLKYNIFSSGFRDGKYTYYAAVKKRKDIEVDEKFELIDLKKQKYAKFVHKAKLNEDFKTENIDDTINSIYEIWLPNSKYRLSDIGIDMIVVTNDRVFSEGESLAHIYLPVETEH